MDERVEFDPIVRIASGKSCWRGLDYFKKGKVLGCVKVDDDAFEGIVEGSEGQQYHVFIDVMHQKKSHCDCPFAEGRRVICKHQVALYFSTHPGSDEKFLEDCRREEAAYDRAFEEEERQRHADIVRYVNSLTKAELRERLIEELTANDWRPQRWDWGR